MTWSIPKRYGGAGMPSDGQTVRAIIERFDSDGVGIETDAAMMRAGCLYVDGGLYPGRIVAWWRDE